MVPCPLYFFFKDTAPTEIYTLSLHDALPIWPAGAAIPVGRAGPDAWSVRRATGFAAAWTAVPDRKSTRLNSSHVEISYAVFCLKKKTKTSMTLCLSLHQPGGRRHRHLRVSEE